MNNRKDYNVGRGVAVSRQPQTQRKSVPATASQPPAHVGNMLRHNLIQQGRLMPSGN